MMLKLSLFISLAVAGFVFADGADDKEVAGFSAETVWLGSSLGDDVRKPVWLDDIQIYHDDIIESFSKFPAGPLLNEAGTVMATFRNYLSKLIVFSNSLRNSAVLSASSTAILEALSNVKIETKSPLGVIEEFYRVLPSLMVSYRSVVSKLSSTIGGRLSGIVNAALTDLELAFKNHMIEFLHSSDERGLKKEVDFKPIAKHAQKLSNAISLIVATTTQNQCTFGGSSDNVHASLISLALVLDHLMICFHGLSGCSQAVLSVQSSDGDDGQVVVHGFYPTLGVFTSGITEALDNVTTLSTSLVNCTDILNSKLNDLFGAFEGVAITAGEITQSVTKNVVGAVCSGGVVNRVTNTIGGFGGIGRTKIFSN